MIKFNQFIKMLYPHQVFILVGHYYKSDPVSRMNNKEEVEELVAGWGDEYVSLLHVKNGMLYIELAINTPRVLI